MAAHLEGKGSSVLDFTGFAQKFGTVLSYIRIADEPANINQVRIEKARADALIGCDLVVSSSPKASSTYRPGHTRALVNTAEMSTGDFVKYRDANLNASERIAAIGRAVGDGNLATVDANKVAEKLMGNTIYANVLLLGCAWQQGLVPVSLDAMIRAIELNAVEVEKNKQAFAWGRVAAVDPDRIERLVDDKDGVITDETLDDIVQRRADFLVDYQDQALADRYRALVQQVSDTEAANGGKGNFAEAVARSYFKLLSYKDEYEVARLHTRSGFLESVRRDFGSKAKLKFHLAPPLLNSRKDARGRPRKKEFGAWVIPLFKILANMRRFRGTKLDVFGMTHDRRLERALITEFEAIIDNLVSELTADNIDQASDVAALFMDIRGYGPVKEQAIEDVRARVSMRLCADDTSDN
jgi:indolepyruvate ferredoxin oxidoreductase